MHRITDKGDIRVQYEGCHNRWTFHPGALTKVTAKDAFSLGDIVRVKSDLAAVKQYQRGHGEWIDVMKNVSWQFLCPYFIRYIAIYERDDIGFILVAGSGENRKGN